MKNYKNLLNDFHFKTQDTYTREELLGVLNGFNEKIIGIVDEGVNEFNSQIQDLSTQVSESSEKYSALEEKYKPLKETQTKIHAKELLKGKVAGGAEIDVYNDLSSRENFDEKEIDKFVEELVKQKPYLSFKEVQQGGSSLNPVPQGGGNHDEKKITYQRKGISMKG